MKLKKTGRTGKGQAMVAMTQKKLSG